MNRVDSLCASVDWAALTPALVLIAAVLLFAVTNYTVSLAVAAYSPSSVIAVSLLLGLLGVPVRYVPSAAADLSRALAVILGCYIALLAPGFAPDPALPDPAGFIGWWRGLAVLGAVLAVVRPSFLVVPLIYVVIYKSLAARHLGFAISQTDYLPLIELGLLLWVGQLILSSRSWTDALRSQCLSLLFLGAVSIHFANYFWSGVAKVLIGDGLTTWVVENQTWYLLLVSREVGMLPLSDTLFLPTVAFFQEANGLSNLTVLTLQLGALLACQWRRSLIAMTLAYDVSHLVIYLVSGILFWKWMLLNLAIVFAASRYSTEYGWRGNRLLLLVLTVVAGSMFFTAKLAWFDTASVTHSRLQAQYSNGEFLDLPSNYLLAGSVTAAQQRLARPHSIGNGTGTWGQTQQPKLMRALDGACEQTVLESGDSHDLGGYWAMIMRHHHWLIEEWADPYVGVLHAYPHHIFSNPSRYERVNGRRVSEIKGYRLVTELVCLSPDAIGGRKVVRRTEVLRAVSAKASAAAKVHSS